MATPPVPPAVAPVTVATSTYLLVASSLGTFFLLLLYLSYWAAPEMFGLVPTLGLAAALAAVTAAILWLQSAVSAVEDKLSNAAAAGFSGAAAFYGAGTITFPATFVSRVPYASWWPTLSGLLGFLIVAATVGTAWNPKWKLKRKPSP